MRGTPISKVFKKFLSSVNDKEWLIVKEDMLEDILLEHLDSATTSFTQCKKDLSFTPLERHSKNIEVVESESPQEVAFEINEGEEIISIRVVDIATNQELEEEVDFKIIEKENTGFYEPRLILLSSTKATTLNITYTLEGFFEELLSPLEILILATSMELRYIRPLILTQDSTKQFVSDKDFTKLSGANMLLRLMGLKKNLEKELDVLQGRYSFVGFKGWN